MQSDRRCTSSNSQTTLGSPRSRKVPYGSIPFYRSKELSLRSEVCHSQRFQQRCRFLARVRTLWSHLQAPGRCPRFVLDSGRNANAAAHDQTLHQRRLLVPFSSEKRREFTSKDVM